MLSFQAAIFDLDGTLLDTLDDLADSANFMLAEHGFPQYPVADYRTHVGDGVRVLMERILPPEAATDETTLAACMETYQAAYSERWQAKTQPYAGIPELLNRLVDAGTRLTVLSNKPHAFTVQVMEAFLSAWPWEIIYGMRDGVPKKPDPAGAHQILEELGLRPEEVVYFGDTNTDMQTAVAAGVHPVGVLWGFRGEEELREAGARQILATPGDFQV